jgi:hypothetical protein
MPTPRLTNEILSAAIDGFEAQKKRLDAQIDELRAMLSGDSTGTSARSGARVSKRRTFSAATRRRMREAQQRRWAAIKGESAPAPRRPKRRISEEGLQRIIAATKRRWARFRAEKKAAGKTGAARKTASAQAVGQLAV